MPENRLFFDMAQSMLTCLLGSYVLVNLIVLPMEVDMCCTEVFGVILSVQVISAGVRSADKVFRGCKILKRCAVTAVFRS